MQANEEFQTADDPSAHSASTRIPAEWPRLVIESIQDFAIMTMNLAGTIVAWNEGAELMFGYRADEAIGQNIAIIFTPEDRANHQDVRERETAFRTGRALDERYHIRKDGSRFYVSGVLTRLQTDTDATNNFDGFVKVARDLTERKEAEEALQQLNETLESRVAERTEQIRSLVTELTLSEQSERRRVSQILHDDLQQRLYSMNFQLTNLRYAMGEGDVDSVNDLFNELEISLHNLVQVTRNLSVDLSPPILHQEGLFEAVRWLAAHMQQQHGLAVTVELTNSMPPLGEDLRVLLFQTIRELLFNIVKHADVSTAKVAINYTDAQIHIQVRDYGRGFDATSQRDQNSQGLLRIQQRMQLVGGTLEVASSPGQGTHIALVYPLAQHT